MQLHLKQLSNHFKQQALATVYLIAGSEILLRKECLTALQQHIRKRGYDERECYFLDTGFNIETLQTSLYNFDLFGKKTLIELRNPKGKFDQQTIDVLQQFFVQKQLDKTLIIITDKLSTAQQKTRWYKMIDQHGIVIHIKPIPKTALASWIENRVMHYQLQIQRDAVQLLIQLTEGNLLATQQAIEKCILIASGSMITAQDINVAIHDSARFSIFDLTTQALLGQTTQALRILNQLRHSDTEATLVLWSITKECRHLFKLSKELQQGKTINQILNNEWQTRKQPLKIALQRMTHSQIIQLIRHAAKIDCIIKGITPGNVWQSLQTLTLYFAMGKSL